MRGTDFRNDFAEESHRFYVSSTGGMLAPFINAANNISKLFFHFIFHRNKKHKFTLITPAELWYLSIIIILYACISYSNSSYCLEYGFQKRPYIFSFGIYERRISPVPAFHRKGCPKNRTRRIKLSSKNWKIEIKSGVILTVNRYFWMITFLREFYVCSLWGVKWHFASNSVRLTTIATFQPNT